MIVHDAHIHVGRISSPTVACNSPENVHDFLKAVGIQKYAASSISTCEGNSLRALPEMLQLQEIAGDDLVPVLWVCPDWMENGELQNMLQSGIQWKCIKVHGYFHQWEAVPGLLDKVVELARSMNVPILFHTGGRDVSDAGSYLDIIKRNADVTFILAHCRPVEQAIEVMKCCPNCYGDTAFTPIEGIEMMIKEGLANRLMFGTDYPLQMVFYPDKDYQAMYREMIDDTRNVMSEDEWELVSHLNFEKVFKI